jgi:hypothetical protein
MPKHGVYSALRLPFNGLSSPDWVISPLTIFADNFE